MMILCRFLISFGLAFCLAPITAFAKDPLKLVTATGRAAILSDENSQETRNRALEDALYGAALRGGAKIDGFSSIQAGTELDDHFVVRPSSKIIDYNVLSEQYDDLHYSITIEAAIGDLPKDQCQNRVVNNVTMFAPTFEIDDNTPAWLAQYPTRLIKSLYETLDKKSNVLLVNRANVKLDPSKLTRDNAYNYKALTSGVTKISDGDFAFSTTITMKRVIVNSGIQENHFIDTRVDSFLFLDSDYKDMQLVTNAVRIPLQSVLPNKFMSMLMSPNRTQIRESFLNLIANHAASLTEKMRCSPLSATVIAKKDGLHVPIGSRQGIKKNRLAVVADKDVPWTILRVVKTSTNSSLLMPLNRQRSIAELSGKSVSFLEFN